MEAIIEVWHALAAWLSFYTYTLPVIALGGGIIWAIVSSVVSSIKGRR